MKKLTLFLLLTFFYLNITSSTNAQEEIILFHSENCAYCEEVFDTIEEHDLGDVLNLQIIEESEQEFSDIFTSALEECDLDPERGGYPTLYHNGDCSVGSSNTIATLLDLAGIEVPQDEEEVRTLNEIAEIEREQVELDPRPFVHYLMMILGPAMLIALGYFMIKKLNL